MLSDRHYMRDADPSRDLAPLHWLVGILCGIYVVQNFLSWVAPGFVDYWLALSTNAVATGRLWTFFTYSLLHTPIVDGFSHNSDPARFLHLFFNVLTIYFLGRGLLPVLGRNRFLLAYAGAVLAAGLFWLAINHTRPDALLGASGASFGLLALFCCLFPNDRITVLLFFVLPVTVVPKYLGWITAGITTLFVVFAEMFGSPDGIAHSAHLGGMIAGVIAFRFIRATDGAGEPAHDAIELPRWMKKKKTTPALGEKFKINISNRETIRAEVDRILDKINTSGFASLTSEEKRTLDEARDLLSKR